MKAAAFHDPHVFTRLPAAYAAHPGLTWAPIRHHSPHCAWQLRRLMEQIRPDVVLVEGPSEANALLPYLLDARTRPPVAFFIHMQPEQKCGVEESRAALARCFVPLAAMSPEWVALREAQRLDIPARFIDLPYLERPSAQRSDDEAEHVLEPPLSDDRLLARADAMATLLAVSGCEDFETWWERHFESGTVYDDPAPFFTRLLHLGQYLREDAYIDEVTRARETHMAAAIAEAQVTGTRCLVVCGAFHCTGILEHLSTLHGVPTSTPDATPAGAAAGVHLVPYSLARLNATRDSAAGIPDCGYQARIWSLLSRRRAEAGAVHGEVHAALAPELVNHLRERGHAATLPDAIEAVALARRLAALRGHGVGRRELRETLISCVVKETRDGGEQRFVADLDRFLAGEETGRVPPGLPLAPLVADFREHCRRMRLPRAASEPLERALDLYRSPAHREQSRFLHRLASLDVPYATRLAGPDFSTGEDLQRVREVWSIRWVPETEACLTERSHYGARLLDAAVARCLEHLDTPRRPGAECVSLLIDALAMGLHELLGAIQARVRHWVAAETEVPALCRGLLRLDAARHARTALGTDGGGDGLQELDALLAACFQRICLRLPWLGFVADENETEIADALGDMLNLVTLETPGCEPEVFFDALQLLLATAPPPVLAGLVHGALLEGGHLEVAAVAGALGEACGLGSLDPEAPGRFLAGFLRAARHRLLQEPVLQQRLGEALQAWDEDDFLAVLPGLRLAFTRLSPRQLGELAARVMPGGEAVPEPMARAWSSAELQRAADLRRVLAIARQAWDGSSDERT
ncbi:DUF5682 family protein [Pseudomonas indica]|uniref:DUF5682 family protein n=1 Tax=Pseudomonas indica TaxID=137658 RepID=UPI003FD5EB6D